MGEGGAVRTLFGKLFKHQIKIGNLLMPVLLEGGEQLVDLRPVLGPQAGLSLHRVDPPNTVSLLSEHY